MARIKLWYSPGACSLAPHVLLHELGVPFEAVAISVRNGATQTEEFARINPKRRVPVLMLDGEVITEVPAIATAIADLVPERQLLGKTPLARARAYEWMAWLSGTLHGQGFGALWRPERFVEDPALFPALQQRARRTIEDCFATIEGRLAEPREGFGAVDPYLLVFSLWGNGLGIPMSDRHPHYTAFARRLVERPSVIATLRAEGIPPLNDGGPG